MFHKILKHYKIAMLISTLLLAAIIGSLVMHKQQTGEFVEKGLDFKGGTEIIVTNVEISDTKSMESVLKAALGSDIIVQFTEGGKNIVVESEGDLDEGQIISILEKEGLTVDESQVNKITLGAALSSAFLNQARKATIVAFIAMAVVVFLTFRKVVPSIAVMLAGISDILAALVGMNLLGIKLSLSTLAALLILIGYSIDTDILLTTRVLKQRHTGTLDERVTASFKTGTTMTLTAVAAMLVLYLISSSAVLDDISLVIIFGLIADLPFTWLQNVGILKWYALKHNIE
jgi:preprotein translocase subunit SecF